MNDVKKEVESVVIPYLINKLREKFGLIKEIEVESFSELNKNSILIITVVLSRKKNEEDIFSVQLSIPMDTKTGNTDINSLEYEIIANNVPLNNSSQNQLLDNTEVSQLIGIIRNNFNSN